MRNVLFLNLEYFNPPLIIPVNLYMYVVKLSIGKVKYRITVARDANFVIIQRNRRGIFKTDRHKKNR